MSIAIALTHRAGLMLIHLHGGAFRRGRKSREARPLLYRLASQGWVCISANYRLSPAATFPDHLIDVKKVIAWAREHGPEYGADPAIVFVAGSSAGGHLAAFAGLTPNDPVFQPGFEGADTSVAAVVSLYGYYGSLRTKGAAALVTPCVHHRGRATVFRGARRQGHADARRRRPALRRATAGRLVESGCLRGAARGTAHIRSVSFSALRGGRRWDRGVRRLGPARTPVTKLLFGPPDETIVPHVEPQAGAASMFVNRMPRYEILSEDAVATLDGGWRRIVSELGIEFLLPEAVDAFAQAGQKVDGQPRQARSRLRARAGGEGAARVRRAGAQPGALDPRRRRPHVVRLGVRAAVRPRGRGAAQRVDGGLRELLQALADLPAARLGGRDDRRARGHAARLAPPGHGARAPDADRQALHGLGHLGREREGHDRDGRDPVRRPRGDRGRSRSRSR